MIEHAVLFYSLPNSLLLYINKIVSSTLRAAVTEHESIPSELRVVV